MDHTETSGGEELRILINGSTENSLGGNPIVGCEHMSTERQPQVRGRARGKVPYLGGQAFLLAALRQPDRKGGANGLSRLKGWKHRFVRGIYFGAAGSC